MLITSIVCLAALSNHPALELEEEELSLEEKAAVLEEVEELSNWTFLFDADELVPEEEEEEN